MEKRASTEILSCSIRKYSWNWTPGFGSCDSVACKDYHRISFVNCWVLGVLFCGGIFGGCFFFCFVCLVFFHFINS